MDEESGELAMADVFEGMNEATLRQMVRDYIASEPLSAVTVIFVLTEYFMYILTTSCSLLHTRSF